MKGVAPVPSKSTLSKYRLIMDIGLMLWTRQNWQQFQGGGVYMLCDSSPVGGRDWFNTEQVFVAAEHLLAVSDAVDNLQDTKELLRGQLDGVELEALKSKRFLWNNVLVTSMSSYVHSPQMLPTFFVHALSLENCHRSPQRHSWRGSGPPHAHPPQRHKTTEMTQQQKCPQSISDSVNDNSRTSKAGPRPAKITRLHSCFGITDSSPRFICQPQLSQ